jgi:hypothetical protein
MAQKNTGPGTDSKEKMAVGLGLAALAAAAAGAYFLYGTKEGAKRRKQMRGWMLRMKGEVMDRMEKMENVSEDAYNKIVDTVARGYKGVKEVDPTEVAVLAAELKKHWKNIKKHLNSGPKKKTRAKKQK